MVLYHKNCPDGFGAAWAAWKKFGNRAEYIALDPDKLPGKPLRKKEIYMLDLSYPKKIQNRLRAENISLIILDHHFSRESDTRAFKENIFSDCHSGAVLAWNYFFPKQKVPWLLRYIEDYDLWKFKLPYSEKISSYIHMRNYAVHVWSAMARELETKKGRKKYATRGKFIYDYGDNLIASIAERAVPSLFAGKYVSVVNSSASELIDRLAHFLLLGKKIPFAVVWYISYDGIKVSLRSNGKFDVLKIAKKYGGGGHRAAAGFLLPLNAPLPWKSVAVRKSKKRIYSSYIWKNKNRS